MAYMVQLNTIYLSIYFFLKTILLTTLLTISLITTLPSISLSIYLGILGLLDEVEDDVPVPFKKRKTSDSAGKNKATPKSAKKATPGI